MGHRKSLSQQVMEFNQDIFAFEDDRVQEVAHLIAALDTLQQSMHAPNSADLLRESLKYIQVAETQEEMAFYQQSFLEALQLTKLHDVLDIDSCIHGLQQCAEDLFYWTDLEVDSDAKQAGMKEALLDIEKSAEDIEKNFNQEARELQEEFEFQIAKNTDEKAQLQKTSDEDDVSKKQKIAQLEELILKYHAGIKRINTQKIQVARALDALKSVLSAKAVEARQHQYDDFAAALSELRLIDKRTGYNHFVNKCEKSVNALCYVRSLYLEKEESIFKPLAKAVWQASKVALPFLHAVHIPDDMPSFTRESVDAAKEVRAQGVVQLGKRQSTSAPPASTFNKVTNFFKKTASILIASASLVLSGLLCLTIIGIPTAVVLAAAGIGALRSGSNFYTEYSKQIKRNKRVISQLEILEKKRETLDQQVLANGHKATENKTQPIKKKPLTSETKIDLLLMGHKPGDILSKSEISKLAQVEKQEPSKNKTVVMLDASEKKPGSSEKPNELKQDSDKSSIQPKH